MFEKRFNFSLRALILFPATLVIFLVLNVQGNFKSSKTKFAATGTEYVLQNHREYGWPWICLTMTPVFDVDKPWNTSLITWRVTHFAPIRLLGNLALASIFCLIPVIGRRLFYRRNKKVRENVSENEL